MIGATRFKVVVGKGVHELEDRLNAWADKLPEGAKIRRTQLAAVLAPDDEPDWLYALVSYDLPAEIR